MKPTISIEVEVDIKSFTSENGKTFMPKDNFVDNLEKHVKNTILNSVNSENSYNEKECSNANVIHEFESLEVKREDVKKYSERSGNYKKFLVYYLKNFKKHYNPLNLEHKEIKPSKKFSLRAKALQTILSFKYIDLGAIHYRDDRERAMRIMQYNHFCVTKENFEDFISFVFDTGMLKLDHKIPNTMEEVNELVPITYNSSMFHNDLRTLNLVEGLIKMCIELDHEKGFDLLVDKYKIELPKQSHDKSDYCYMKFLIAYEFERFYKPEYVGKIINSLEEAKEEFPDCSYDHIVISKWEDVVKTNKYIKWVGKITKAFNEHKLYGNESLISALSGYGKYKSKCMQIISFLDPTFVENNTYEDIPEVKLIKKFATHKSLEVTQRDYDNIRVWYRDPTYGNGWRGCLYMGKRQGIAEKELGVKTGEFYVKLYRHKDDASDLICVLNPMDHKKNVNGVKRLVKGLIDREVTKNNYKDFLLRDTIDIEKQILEKEKEICRLKKKIGQECK